MNWMPRYRGCLEVGYLLEEMKEAGKAEVRRRLEEGVTDCRLKDLRVAVST